MTHLVRFLAVVAASVMIAAGNPAVAAETAPRSAGLPAVVLVHGAFADGSDRARLIPLLKTQGVHATAVQNPLTSLADDVAATRRAMAARPGSASHVPQEVEPARVAAVILDAVRDAR